MASKKIGVTMIVAIAALFAMVAFMIWAFAQAGTLGMYRWGYRTPVLALIALGMFPIIIAAAATLVRAHGVKAVVNGICVALSIISILAMLGVSLYIFSNAYGAPASDKRPALIDPAKGFPLRTGIDGAPTFRVAISSDGHYGTDTANAEARSAILKLSQSEYQAGTLDAFINLGDTAQMGMLAGDWREALESITRDAPTLPFLSLMGNHDSLVGGAARWRASLAGGTGPGNVPNGGLSASSWRMDEGTAHFIALDLLWGPEGFGAAKKAWLKKQLDSIPAEDYIIVLSHCFFYSSGYIDEGSGMPWYDHEEMLSEVGSIIAGKADLVVSGHNHYMEWLEADGTAWAVAGVLGGKPDPAPTYVSPESQWISQGVFGRLVVELTAAGLVCEFQDQTGKALFTRTIIKRK